MGTEPERKKIETAVSNPLGIIPKIRGGGNSAKVRVNAASSETMIAYLVYWTCLKCDGSVKCHCQVFCQVFCHVIVLSSVLGVDVITSCDYLKKTSVKRNVATDKGNNRNEN